jgi:hypothetical protein
VICKWKIGEDKVDVKLQPHVARFKPANAHQDHHSSVNAWPSQVAQRSLESKSAKDNPAMICGDFSLVVPVDHKSIFDS